VEIARPAITSKAHSKDHPNITKETTPIVILEILETFFNFSVFLKAYPVKQKTKNQPQY
jgi:hypothetical protein